MGHQPHALVRDTDRDQTPPMRRIHLRVQQSSLGRARQEKIHRPSLDVLLQPVLSSARTRELLPYDRQKPRGRHQPNTGDTPATPPKQRSTTSARRREGESSRGKTLSPPC